MVSDLLIRQKWFVLAFVLLVLAIIYTVIFSTHILLYPTLHIEQLLLLRPITRGDCVLRQWARLGDVDVSILFVCVLGVGCILLGYRRRVLTYLLLLLLLGVGVELVGKQTLPQKIPGMMQNGLSSLRCTQLAGQPRSERFLVAVGAWWKAPVITEKRREIALRSARAPLVFDDDTQLVYGYPSGHAIRWSFLGFVTCWLLWRHVRRRPLRIAFVVMAVIIALGGGFAQFYIGNHLSTDLIIGYLVGTSAACCAIGLLLCNQKRPLVFEQRGHVALSKEDVVRV